MIDSPAMRFCTLSTEGTGHISLAKWVSWKCKPALTIEQLNRVVQMSKFFVFAKKKTS